MCKFDISFNIRLDLYELSFGNSWFSFVILITALTNKILTGIVPAFISFEVKLGTVSEKLALAK